MFTAQQLRQKHKEELETLQANCPHMKVTDWMDQWWAPGHSTGNLVRVCYDCEKVMDTKSKYTPMSAAGSGCPTTFVH